MKPAASKSASTFSWPWPRLSRSEAVAFLLRVDEAARQRHDLANLDDRMLEDIGITRADVERELSRPLRW